MQKIGNIVWGVLLILIGVIIGLNALDITDINIFFDGWWTLFIIIPCFLDLFKEKDKTGNVIGLIVGIALLLACQDFISFGLIWKLFLPTILIIIGLSILFKDIFGQKIKEEISKLDEENSESHFAAFGGQNVNYDNETFKGCEINAIFGSVKCDLRKAKIKKDVVINATSVFGGVEILVPDNVKVKVSSTPIFGGISNKSIGSDDDAKIIYIKGTCIFGGIEIK